MDIRVHLDLEVLEHLDYELIYPLSKSSTWMHP